jgi:hypothetical protein
MVVRQGNTGLRLTETGRTALQDDAFARRPHRSGLQRGVCIGPQKQEIRGIESGIETAVVFEFRSRAEGEALRGRLTI